jgi:hypothetical protein
MKNIKLLSYLFTQCDVPEMLSKPTFTYPTIGIPTRSCDTFKTLIHSIPLSRIAGWQELSYTCSFAIPKVLPSIQTTNLSHMSTCHNNSFNKQTCFAAGSRKQDVKKLCRVSRRHPRVQGTANSDSAALALTPGFLLLIGRKSEGVKSVLLAAAYDQAG